MSRIVWTDPAVAEPHPVNDVSSNPLILKFIGCFLTRFPAPALFFSLRISIREICVTRDPKFLHVCGSKPPPLVLTKGTRWILFGM